MNVWKAAKAGKLDWFENHVATGSHGDLNSANKSGETPLMIAVKEQQEEIVRFLLEKGADPNKLDGKSGHSALLIAVIEGCGEDIVAALLDHNADANAKDEDGCTALHWAVRSEQEALVRLLLARGADPNRKTTKEGLAPLHYAGNQNITQELLAHAADQNAVDKKGQTPLFAAVNADYANVARELVTSGCDLNVQNNEGDTVLHLLANSGEDTTNILLFVLAKHPDLNVQNKDGDTPLHLARASGHEAIAELLIKNGAKTDIKNNKGEQASSSSKAAAASEGSPVQTAEAATQPPPSTPAKGEKAAEKVQRRKTPSRRSDEDDTEVSEFLVEAGLEVHVPRFKRNKLIDLEHLEGLDDKRLKKMNITAGEREKILAELAKLAPVLAARREERERELKQAVIKKESGGMLPVWAAAGAVLLLSLIVYFAVLA